MIFYLVFKLTNVNISHSGRGSGDDFRIPEIASDSGCFSFILFSFLHVVSSRFFKRCQHNTVGHQNELPIQSEPENTTCKFLHKTINMPNILYTVLF